jgi:hypothetical protein
MEEKYQGFLGALNQMAQDQAFYESELIHQDELKGVRHEEIVKLGSIMVKRLQKFAAKGETFMDDLPSPDILPSFIDAIQSYQLLIVPPKPFGGFCPCLKPARDGPEYDRKFFSTKAKMVSSVFVSYAILILKKGEEVSSRCSQFDVFVDDMNRVFNPLCEIKCVSSDPKHLENVRHKLLKELDNVDKFIQLHADRSGKPEFKVEAVRSIRKVQDLLVTKAAASASSGDTSSASTTTSVPIGRRILIKAQSTLQEIMNSAAAISASEGREQLEMLENLLKTLKKSRDSEVSQFNSMEEQMNELTIIDVLSRLREGSEIIYSDANSKIRDCIKRWQNIKNKSTQRKVAEFTEEAHSSDRGSSSFNPVSIGNPASLISNPNVKPIDPRKITRGATEKFKEIGGKFDEFGNKTKEKFDEFGNKTKERFDEFGHNILKVGALFTGDSESLSSHGSDKVKGGDGAAGGNKTSGQKPAVPPRKKPAGL